MADAAVVEEEEEALPEVERRLIESTLWKEDVFTLDHTEVWGSFYDKNAKVWGYACCSSIQRLSPCVVAKKETEKAKKVAAKEAAKRGEDSEEYSPDSDAEGKDERRRPLDWSNAPPELLPREKFANAAEYVEHFIRWAIGAWREQIDKGFAGYDLMSKQKFEKSLPEAIQPLTLLIRKLRKGESLQKGEDQSMMRAGRSRETRTSMEGKFLGESKVIDQFEAMITFSYDRNYVQAHKEYMLMTLGHKRWNNTFVQHVSACTMKGAREYRRNRDNLNSYDMDPTSQKYMHAMRKLVHFTQVIRPSPDQSMNVVL